MKKMFLLIVTAVLVFAAGSRSVIYASSSCGIEAGAGRYLEGDVHGAIAAGEAFEERFNEAEYNINAILGIVDTPSYDGEILSGDIFNNTVSESAVVRDDGTVCGYTNLGIAKVDNWLNVRKEPSEQAEIIGKLPKHAGCEILEIADGWAHIKSGKVNGYSKLEYLYTGEEAKEIAPKYIRLMATVTTTTLYVRQEPTTESSVITMVPLEEELEVLEETPGWCKISIDDEEGYISKDYVTLAEELDKAVTIAELKYGQGISDTRVKMVAFAKQFLGNRYVWGGTSLTKGTDCSGFTMGIYRNFGVSLPRVSRSQAQVGTRVKVSELRPGDLVFYGKGSYINHVAMYIGNGQVIHASSPKTGIKISNVGYRTPITCRRILSN